jgi:hypothetical protein
MLQTELFYLTYYKNTVTDGFFLFINYETVNEILKHREIIISIIKKKLNSNKQKSNLKYIRHCMKCQLNYKIHSESLEASFYEGRMTKIYIQNGM